MKSLLWFVGGFAAVATYLLLSKRQPSVAAEPVEQLAHKLQDAWADHHTVA